MKMIKNGPGRKSINWLFAFSVILFLTTRLIKHGGTPTDRIHLSLQTFHSEEGWGYDVLTNDSLFIHQPNIPAISGKNGFLTEADAQKIGTLVMNKIQQSRLPVITLKELDSCGIYR